MAVLVRCASCRAEFRAQDKYRGKETSCPRCHKSLIVDGSSIPDYDVFISYSSADKPAADAVCAALEAKRWRCWIAPRDVLAGSEWGGAIVEAIERSRLMVLVYSAHANQSQQVIREVERAVNKNLPLIPFRIEAAAPSKNMEYFLSASHWLDAMNAPMEQHLEKLSNAVKALLTLQPDLEKPGESIRGEVIASSLPRKTNRRTLTWSAAVIGMIALAVGLAYAFRIFPRDFSSNAAAPSSQPATTQSAPISTRTVLVPRHAFVLREKHPVERVEVNVPAIESGAGTLWIVVYGMGDKGKSGMRFLLLNDKDEIVFKESGEKTRIFTYDVTSNTKWAVVLADHETPREGNVGAVEVSVVPK